MAAGVGVIQRVLDQVAHRLAGPGRVAEHRRPRRPRQRQGLALGGGPGGQRFGGVGGQPVQRAGGGGKGDAPGVQAGQPQQRLHQPGHPVHRRRALGRKPGHRPGVGRVVQQDLVIQRQRGQRGLELVGDVLHRGFQELPPPVLPGLAGPQRGGQLVHRLPQQPRRAALVPGQAGRRVACRAAAHKLQPGAADFLPPAEPAGAAGQHHCRRHQPRRQPGPQRRPAPGGPAGPGQAHLGQQLPAGLAGGGAGQGGSRLAGGQPLFQQPGGQPFQQFPPGRPGPQRRQPAPGQPPQAEPGGQPQRPGQQAAGAPVLPDRRERPHASPSHR